MSKLTFIVTAWGERRPKALIPLLASLNSQTRIDFNAVIVEPEWNRRTQFILDNFIDVKTSHVGSPLGKPHTKEEMYKASAALVGEARGEWLAFPNDDTYLTPVFVERMLKAAEENNADFVYCDIISGRPDCKYSFQDSKLVCGHIDKCAFIIKKQAFIDLDGFPEEPHGWYGADGALAELVAQKNLRTYKVDEPLAVHN